MTQAAPPSLRQSSRTVLRGLLDRRPGLGTVEPADDAVARGLATAKGYAFASVDFPARRHPWSSDSNGTTAVGAFDFDPADTKPITAFTFAGGAYEILTIPNSTASLATGVNADGLIIGLSRTCRGYCTASRRTRTASPTWTSRAPPPGLKPSGSTVPGRSWAASSTPT